MSNKTPNSTPDQKRKDQGIEQFKLNREEIEVNEASDDENKSSDNPSDPQDQPAQVGSKHPHTN